MDERALLLLGLLKAQSQHGYQLNEFIERNLGWVTDMKKPTAYALLERVCRDGFATMRTEQAGNRPARKVYAITPQGEAAFLDLLRTTLASAERSEIPGDIAIIFLDQLPLAEARALLEQHLAHSYSRRI